MSIQKAYHYFIKKKSQEEEEERGREKDLAWKPKQITKNNKLHQSKLGVWISIFFNWLLLFMDTTNKNNSSFAVINTYEDKNKAN